MACFFVNCAVYGLRAIECIEGVELVLGKEGNQSGMQPGLTQVGRTMVHVMRVATEQLGFVSRIFEEWMGSADEEWTRSGCGLNSIVLYCTKAKCLELNWI